MCLWLCVCMSVLCAWPAVCLCDCMSEYVLCMAVFVWLCGCTHTAYVHEHMSISMCEWMRTCASVCACVDGCVCGLVWWGLYADPPT